MIFDEHADGFVVRQFALHARVHLESTAARSPQELVKRLVCILVGEVLKNAVRYRRTTRVSLRHEQYFKLLSRAAAAENLD
jgi:hypothetical protein